MAHTPGPWRVHSEHADRIIVNGCCVYQVGNIAVPDSYEPGVMGEPNPDDVQLMATAPQLLRELNRLLSLWEEAIGYEEDYMDMADVTREVIAKAEGRSDDQ